MSKLSLWVRHLAPGFVAILLASSVLLLSDVSRRPRTELGGSASEKAAGAEPVKKAVKVALLQMASQPILEDGAAGVVSALAEKGYVEGQLLTLKRFNAAGDMATANAMAQELSGGDYDLVITLSTPCLQAMANANKKTAVPHVFGMVSDPSIAGVGIGPQPHEHPAHLVGIGTLPPADRSIELAREVNPKLSRIGVVWNPAEVNSEIATKAARAMCQKLHIELLEANAENTAAVREAAASLIDRQVEALWVGGDVTVLGAIDVVIKAAQQAKIPVFTCIPGNKGTLFDLGANYFEVGRKVGSLASEVLDGASMSQLKWERAVPPKLFVNKLALDGLSSDWKFPQSMTESADVVVDANGTHEKPKPTATPAAASNAPTKKWKLRLIAYINSLEVEESEHGLLDGLKAAGLQRERDFEWKVGNAQGDIATLQSLVDAAVNEQADMLLTISTQTLQAASRRAKNVPVVFTMVANPFAAGVGTTDSEHLPHVSGAYGAQDSEAMMPILRQLRPNAKKFGTLFSPAEVNSVASHKLLEAAIKQTGVPLVSVGVNTPSEVPDATQSLCSQELDALCLTNSNLATSSFPSIAQPAKRAKIPIFGFIGSMAKQGATVVLARDFYDMGHSAGGIAARIIRGESPSKIPFSPQKKSRLLINLDAARDCGLTVPPELLKSADQVIGKP